MTYIRKKYRLSIREAFVELGLKCNFKCRHCFQGESQDVAITPEVVNAVCDNILWIDELHFAGGEPMLYVDELRMILKIFKKRRIRVNYLGITTNMSMQSQEFADVYNEWADYVAHPDESGLEVSIDPFHLEFITRHQIDQNIAFYREKCPSLKPKERIGVFDNTMQKVIVSTGRAKNLTDDDKKSKCHIIESEPQSISPNYEIIINKKCVGKDGKKTNPCGYKCVKNCAFSGQTFVLYHDGSFSNNSILSLENAKKRGFIIGNILTDNLYESVNEFNEKCKSLPDDSTNGERTIWFDRDGIDETITNEKNKANYSAIIGDLDQAEEHIRNAIELLNATIRYSDIIIWFGIDNELSVQEALKDATQEELDDLESRSLTRGVTTPETRQEFRDKYLRLYDELDGMREKIEEMQKNNTYGAIR